MYLVSNYYRGAMNVDDMRGFRSKTKAKAYWQKLLKQHHPALGTSGVRAYELFEGKPPRLIRTMWDWLPKWERERTK